MSKDINIKDKNRSTNKVVVGIFLALLVLFILIRVVALNSSSEDGITVIQPDLDSVKLDNNTSKIAKFEKEHEEELAKENNYGSSDPQPSNYNFKEMYSVKPNETKTASTQTVAAVEVKEVKKTNYGRYEPVSNNSEVLTDAQIKAIQKSKTKQQAPEVNNEPAEVEQRAVVTSPFGTYSSNKSKGNSNSNSGVKTKDAYKCFLHSDQKIINGGGCIFRAGEDIVLEDRTIKRNSILYGSANYQGQRVMIKINRVKSPEGEYAVNLIVYDNDFVKGIFFKNAYDEVAEKTTDDVANDGIEVNPSLIKTGAKAVIHAGKNVGDAIKKERALHLQEGYIIYIKEPKQNDNN